MWQPSLFRELAVMLLLKLVALTLIWLAFFHHPAVPTQNQVGRHLLGELHPDAPPSAQTRRLQGGRDGN